MLKRTCQIRETLHQVSKSMGTSIFSKDLFICTAKPEFFVDKVVFKIICFVSHKIVLLQKVGCPSY